MQCVLPPWPAGIVQFCPVAGTNEIIFGFINSSWAVCAPVRRVLLPERITFLPGFSRPFFRGAILRPSRNSSHDKPEKPARQTRPADNKGKNGEMGAALRSVYQKTVDEAVPREMLDLLGKLG